MDRLWVPLLMLITSLLGYLYFARRLSFERRNLWEAIGFAFELIGCWVLVFGANLVSGLLLIWLVRRLTGFFISFYEMKSLVFVLFTVLQALVFYHWWYASRHR